MNDFFKEIDEAAEAVSLDNAFLTVDRKVLLDALKRVSRAVPKRSASFPILHNVLIAAGADGVTLTATNLELRISITLEGAAASFDGMSVCLPYAKLYHAANRFRCQKIGFFAAWNPRSATIRGGLSEMTVGAAEAADFPTDWITLDMSVRNVVANAYPFFNDLQMAAKCASDDDSRRALQTVCIETEADHLRMTATDGKRLISLESQKTTGGKLEFPALLPRKYIPAVVAAFPDRVQGDLYMDRYDNYLRFSDRVTSVTVRLIEGAFPLWRQVVPAAKDLAGRFEFSAFAMLWMIRNATICASDIGRTELVVTPGSVLMTSTDSEGNQSSCKMAIAPEALTLPIGKENLQLSLNWKFFADACDIGDPVTMRFSDSVHPVVCEAPGVVYVLMPIRVK